MAAPESTQMARDSNEPQGCVPLPSFYCCVWRAQYDYWKQQQVITHAELVTKRKTLSETETELKNTKQELENTIQKLNSTAGALEAKSIQCDEVTASLKQTHEQLESTVHQLHDVTLELRESRQDLDQTKHSRAHARWNLTAGLEKAAEAKKHFQDTANIRLKLIHQSEQEKHAVVEEVLRQKKEKLAKQQKRQEELTDLKTRFDEQISGFLEMCAAEIEDTQTDLGASVRKQILSSLQHQQAMEDAKKAVTISPESVQIVAAAAPPPEPEPVADEPMPPPVTNPEETPQ